jgi:hypothetical protein
MQMLRIEKHFAAKKQKLSKPIKDDGDGDGEEEDKPRQKQKKTQSSSSLNSMTFNQL